MIPSLLEVESDKVTVEVPSPTSGVLLKIETQKGQAANVGDLLAVIGMVGETVEEAPTEAESKVEGQRSVETLHETFDLRPSTNLGFISPVVAKIDAEHGVDLSQVRGTGLNGRITKNDILAFVEGEKKTIYDGPQTMVNRPSSTAVSKRGNKVSSPGKPGGGLSKSFSGRVWGA